MALYVYITKECKEDAANYSRYDEMMRLRDRVEQTQRTCHLDNFPPSNYLKKRFDRQIRLVADCRTISVGGEEHVVLSFLRTYVRGSKDYIRFLKNPDDFGERILAPLVSDESLREFLTMRLRDEPVPPKAPPSEVESHFLYRFLGSDPNRSADEFVCESEHWIQCTNDKRIKDRLVLLCGSLAEIIDAKPDETVRAVREYSLVFRWFPRLSKFFLAGIAHGQDERQKLENEYAHILTAPAHEVTEEELLKNSARAYPSYIVFGEDDWMDIQKDVEANLALSPEETDVLESVHSRQGGFPIFINGRAGSGKSTILYYLFADYVNLYLELQGQHESTKAPLLLSCSHELRRQAERTVANLIKSNPRWRREDGQAAEAPSDCFQEFQTFLRALLPEDERTIRFDPAKYIDFARFRRMWQSHFEKNKRIRSLGPDLSWHVIRTFIKGTNSEEYLEPEDYEHLPRKQKSVSQASFTAVYEGVWEGWYCDLCEQDGYWDDQDLARYVFANDLAQPIYPAVFCDEAQDFTRVELDLIFRLCLFTNRKLRHEDVNRVPFAFAGDPFQTLNPTGFRWDAIQALFHDRLVDTLGENLYKQIDLNYQELSLNYRSTKNIVRLCNLIQAYRAAVFDISTLRPQQSWQTEAASPMPVWFDRNETTHWKQLQHEKDVTIIVPCMLNEEQGFVQKDEYLKSVVQTDDLGTPVNVLSPARAKGLEFGRVVLYGFADKEPEKLLASLEKSDQDDDSLLPFEYFVNQLYVAASRPKRRLFIIDSQKGRDSFWKIANDEALQQKLWNRLSKGKEIWAPHIGGFEIGTIDSWSEDRGDQEENARLFKQQGMVQHDPFLLRSAAVSYENLGKSIEALECRAHALNFEGRHVEAGEHFQKAGMPTAALKCFWTAGTGAKDRILSLHKAYPDIGRELEYRLMQVLGRPTPATVGSMMKDLALRAKDDGGFSHRLASEPTFKDVIWAYGDFLQSADANSEELNRFLSYCEILLEKRLPPSGRVLAQIYFNTRQYEKAVRWWESGEGYAVLADYRAAKTFILAEAYQKNPDQLPAPEDAPLLADHFCSQGSYLLAARCLAQSGKPNQLIELMEKVPIDFNRWQDLLTLAAEALARKGEWGLLIDLGELSAGKKPRVFSNEVVKRVGSKAPQVANAIVASCVSSPDFPNLNSGLLKRYSDYFKNTLIATWQWRDDLTLEAVGAAIERSGRQVDALQFYEQVIKGSSFNRHEKNFARKRWVATKEKQAKRESETGHEQAARRYSREASEKRREYGIGETGLPDFPTVDAIWVGREKKATIPESDDANGVTAPKVGVVDSAEAITSKIVEFEIAKLRFEYCPARQKVNITNKETMDTANIRADTLALRSSDVEVIEHGESFVCDSWGAECRFLSTEGLICATFRLRDIGVSVEFEFEEHTTE